MAGGLWTGKHAKKAAGVEEASCRQCGACTPTMRDAHRHMFWDCMHGKVKAFRQDAWRFKHGFDPELLPDLIACYGAAPDLKLEPENSFLGQCGGEAWRSPKKPRLAGTTARRTRRRTRCSCWRT